MLTTNAGLVFMRLKPRNERDMDVEEVVQQLRRKLAVVPGIRTFVQNPPAVRVGARLSKAPYQYTLQDIDLDELYKWAGIIENKQIGRASCRERVCKYV